MMRFFCHGIPFFPLHKIDFFSYENVQYDKPCCTDGNMDGECMDQSCAWKQPCEYVVATTMTSHHDLITLSAMNTISTIVITTTTASSCTATTITITTTEYLFTSTISPCHMSTYIFITLTAMTTNLTISRYSH